VVNLLKNYILSIILILHSQRHLDCEWLLVANSVKPAKENKILKQQCFRDPCGEGVLKTIDAAGQLRVQLWSVNQRATEAEESSLLRFVTRKRLVKA
jgi:hypothetical protein